MPTTLDCRQARSDTLVARLGRRVYPRAMVPLEGVRTALQATLAGRRDVRVAILFGSVARGTAAADSDVDLAVDVAPGVDLSKLSRRQQDKIVELLSSIDEDYKKMRTG